MIDRTLLRIPRGRLRAYCATAWGLRLYERKRCQFEQEEARWRISRLAKICRDIYPTISETRQRPNLRRGRRLRLVGICQARKASAVGEAASKAVAASVRRVSRSLRGLFMKGWPSSRASRRIARYDPMRGGERGDLGSARKLLPRSRPARKGVVMVAAAEGLS